MQVIIYMENGFSKVTFPYLDTGMTIEEIAQKDVPDRLKYFIVDYDSLPTEPQESWDIDNDGNVTVNQEKLLAITVCSNQMHKTRLLDDAKNTINIWQTELQLGIISDENKARLIVWMQYINSLLEVDVTKTSVTWPALPA